MDAAEVEVDEEEREEEIDCDVDPDVMLVGVRVEASVGVVMVGTIEVASASSLALAKATVAVKANGVTAAADVAAGGVHIPLLYVGLAASFPSSTSVPSSSCRLLKSSGSITLKIEPVESLLGEDDGLDLGGVMLLPRRGLVG